MVSWIASTVWKKLVSKSFCSSTSKQVDRILQEICKINCGGSTQGISKWSISLDPAWSGGHASTSFFVRIQNRKSDLLFESLRLRQVKAKAKAKDVSIFFT